MGVCYRIFVFAYHHVRTIQRRRALLGIGLELFSAADSREEASASEVRISKFCSGISLAPTFGLCVLRSTTQLGHPDRGLALAAAPLYKCEPGALRISKLVRQRARSNIPHRTGMGEGGYGFGG